ILVGVILVVEPAEGQAVLLAKADGGVVLGLRLDGQAAEAVLARPLARRLEQRPADAAPPPALLHGEIAHPSVAALDVGLHGQIAMHPPRHRSNKEAAA